MVPGCIKTAINLMEMIKVSNLLGGSLDNHCTPAHSSLVDGAVLALGHGAGLRLQQHD